MKERFAVGDFVIVNTFDRPMSALIARVVRVDELSIAAEYCNIAGYGVMDGVTEATPVADFGMSVEVEDGYYRAVPNGTPYVAVYKDGSPRKWQEEA